MFISLIIKGGPVMIPIIILFHRRPCLHPRKALDPLEDSAEHSQVCPRDLSLSERGLFQKAMERCEKVRHPIGDVFKLGIFNRSLKREEIGIIDGTRRG